MAKRKPQHKVSTSKVVSETAKSNPQRKKQPKSLALAQKEVRTTEDYARLMCALMCDVIQEDVSPKTVNAAVNAGRQMIKMAELKLKYGQKTKKIPSLDLLTGELK